MNVMELISHIAKFVPFALSKDWDNNGLIIGDYDAEVTKIGVCLDPTYEAVVAADLMDCNVLVSHHPLIFKPIKSIIHEEGAGATIMEAIRHDMNIIALHTCWDLASGGVNDSLAELLGLKNICVLDEDSGFGSCGVLKKPMKVHDFLEHVKTAWKLSHIDYYHYTTRNDISRVALCGGSGAKFWTYASEWDADIYLTADMKYHELIDASHELLAVGLVDHGEMERASLPSLAKKLAACKVETVIVNDETAPLPFGIRALPEPLRI